jgi:hypothetical protein
VATSASEILLLDPSFLFSAGGLASLRDDQVRDGVIVSRTFRRWLSNERDLAFPAFVADDDAKAFGKRREQLVGLIDGIKSFSYEGVDLPDGPQDILRALLNSGNPNAELLADEWAFLQSRSWMVSKLRRPYEAFRDAGATIIEVGGQIGNRLIARVIPADKIPPVLMVRFRAKAAASGLGSAVPRWELACWVPRARSEEGISARNLGPLSLGSLIRSCLDQSRQSCSPVRFASTVAYRPRAFVTIGGAVLPSVVPVPSWLRPLTPHPPKWCGSGEPAATPHAARTRLCGRSSRVTPQCSGYNSSPPILHARSINRQRKEPSCY